MKNSNYYMNLDYKVIITPDTHFDGSTYFIAEYGELEGLIGTGENEFDALNDRCDTHIVQILVG